MAFIFLKRDVNIKLVLIIVVLVAAIAVFSAFYQTKFKNISIDYENKTKQLEKITAKAVFGETKSFELAQQQDNIKKDKEALEQNYKSIDTENRGLKNELASTAAELAITKSQLSEARAKFDILQGRFNEVDQSLVNANDDISRLSFRVKELCKELENAGGSDGEC